MTAKKAPSLKTLEKACKAIDFKTKDQNIIVTSPYIESVIASSIISQTLSKMNALFHITPSQPAMTIDNVNKLKENYDSSAMILVGIDVYGKKRLKKGSGYPLLIGGTVESEQIEPFRLGTDSTIPAAGYVLSMSLLEPTDYILQMSAAGSLLSEGMKTPKIGAGKEVIDLAKSKNLVEERKGFKLFGATTLPLDEALRFNTRPYIPKISGHQEACDKILNDAEIPIQKLRAPISNLSAPQAQRLTSVLTMEIDPTIIPLLLGTDYILTLERENSPLRYVSGLGTIGATAWSLNELGALVGILLGDRGRVLRGLIDSHMSYHKEVIFTVQRLETNLQGDSTTTTTTISLKGAKTEILPDVGRIALESGIVDRTRPVALDNEESFTIVWPSSELNVKEVLHEFLSSDITLWASSHNSITLIGNDEVKATALEKIAQLNKGGSSK